jgi:signal transduction histidine kinase
MLEQKPFDCQFRVRVRGGEVRWLHCRSAPRPNSDDGLVWDGIAIDVTERKNAETALREADRRKDEFLAVLAHELRNPLAPVRNALQIMRLAGDNRLAVEQARTMMERQVHQMVRLVDDLLDISRITRGKVELKKERVALSSVVASAVETSRPLIETARHDLQIVLPAETLELHADSTRLAQVLSNLLNNAAKYSDPGGKIRLSAERQGDCVAVRVRDTGIGIPAEMIPRIFDMFMQVDRTSSRTQAGLGVGLTLVRTLVEMHDGTVEVHSDGLGQGVDPTGGSGGGAGRLPRARAADAPRPHRR